MVRGVADFPFTRQYRNTIPYLYFIQQQVCVGTGPAARHRRPAGQRVGPGAAGAEHLAHAARARHRPGTPGRVGHLGVDHPLLWADGGVPRQVQPLHEPDPPLRAVAYGRDARLAVELRSGAGSGEQGTGRGRRRHRPVAAADLAACCIRAAGADCRLPGPSSGRWPTSTASTAASIPGSAPAAGSTRMPRRFGHPLGTVGRPAAQGHSRRAGHGHGRHRPDAISDWSPYEEDTPEKYAILKEKLRASDYVAYSSKRIYDSVDELPRRYPATNLYYDAMWDGRLGFELAAEFTSPPNLLGYTFDDRHADESWSLYDHPQVTVFRKVRDLSDAEFDAVFGDTWQQAVAYDRGPDSPLSPLLNAIGLGSSEESANRGLINRVIGALTGNEAPPKPVDPALPAAGHTAARPARRGQLPLEHSRHGRPLARGGNVVGRAGAVGSACLAACLRPLPAPARPWLSLQPRPGLASSRLAALAPGQPATHPVHRAQRLDHGGAACRGGTRRRNFAAPGAGTLPPRAMGSHPGRGTGLCRRLPGLRRHSHAQPGHLAALVRRREVHGDGVSQRYPAQPLLPAGGPTFCGRVHQLLLFRALPRHLPRQADRHRHGGGLQPRHPHALCPHRADGLRRGAIGGQGTGSGEPGQ